METDPVDEYVPVEFHDELVGVTSPYNGEYGAETGETRLDIVFGGWIGEHGPVCNSIGLVSLFVSMYTLLGDVFIAETGSIVPEFGLYVLEREDISVGSNMENIRTRNT